MFTKLLIKKIDQQCHAGKLVEAAATI